MANDAMSGRNRLPSGGPRKASQKRMRPAAPKMIQIEIPWRPGDRVRWRDHSGVYKRDVDGELADVQIGERVYRVRRAELRPG
jgi:hypothetical protein